MPNADADCLVLAGDICPLATHRQQFEQLIAYCAETWKQTYMVAGNHEYYGGKIHETDTIIREIVAPFANVHFLQQDAIDLDDNVTICGCTLWSETLEPLLLNDYTQIRKDSDDFITYYDTLTWHYDSVAWLEEKLQKIHERGRRAIVITHHLPSFRLIAPQFKNGKYNAGFASHLENLMERAAIWICGHTHVPLQTVIGNCNVFINPRGYPNETVYRPMLANLGLS